MDNIKALFLAVIGNLITPTVVTLGGIGWGYFSPYTIEVKLIIINIALTLSAIILLLSNRYVPRRVKLVHVKGYMHQYIIENNTYKHIPDSETFNYLGQVYGFAGKDSEEINDDKFKKFSSGSMLPSILPFCKEYYEKMIKQPKQ